LAKWNAYVDVANNLGRVNNALNQYLAAFGQGPRLTLPERELTITMWSNNLVTKPPLAQAMSLAKGLATQEPVSSLDQGAQAFFAVAEPLWAQMLEMADYLKNKKYLDDDLARGQELHAQILANIEKLKPVFLVFQKNLSDEDVARRAQEFQEMRDQGLQILPAMMETLSQAEKIQILLTEREVKAEDVLTKVPEAEFSPLYKALAEKLTVLEKTLTEEQARQEGLVPQIARQFLEGAQKYKLSAAALLEAIQSGQAPKPMSDGSPSALSQRFEYMINRYNALI
jgi:hypothetical protein